MGTAAEMLTDLFDDVLDKWTAALRVTPAEAVYHRMECDHLRGDFAALLEEAADADDLRDDLVGVQCEADELRSTVFALEAKVAELERRRTAPKKRTVPA